MKKMNLFYILIFTLLIVGCNDSINEPTQNPSLISLSGKINDYQPDGTVVLRMECDYIYSPPFQVDSIIVLDSTIIESDGSFRMTLSKPPEVLLKPKNGLGCAGLVFSNDTVRTYPSNTFRLYKNNQRIGYIYCAEKAYGNDFYVGEYVTTLMYSEDNLTVTGDCIGQSGNHINIDTHNLNLVKGWNFLIKTITEYTDSTLIQESIIKNNFKGNWIYQGSN